MRQLLRAEEVAAMLGMSVSTVRWMAWADKLPCIRIGPRVVRFDPGEIERFVDARRTQKAAA